MTDADFSKTWFLISPDGKLLFASEDDYKENKASYYLDPTSGNFVSIDTIPKRNWAAVKSSEPQPIYIP